jgi:hypothetical protein
MKGNADNAKGRNINIIICSLQIISPLLMNAISIITLSQTEDFMSMIKHYVAMGFIITIDDLFVTVIPKEIQENAVRLNKSGLLKVRRDSNSTVKVLKRVWRAKFMMRPGIWA